MRARNISNTYVWNGHFFNFYPYFRRLMGTFSNFTHTFYRPMGTFQVFIHIFRPIGASLVIRSTLRRLLSLSCEFFLAPNYMDMNLKYMPMTAVLSPLHPSYQKAQMLWGQATDNDEMILIEHNYDFDYSLSCLMLLKSLINAALFNAATLRMKLFSSIDTCNHKATKRSYKVS